MLLTYCMFQSCKSSLQGVADAKNLHGFKKQLFRLMSENPIAVLTIETATLIKEVPEPHVIAG